MIEKFFQEVMEDLGLLGWTLRWLDHDAYCWRSYKRIDICPMDQDEVECKQMLLHEIAHILEDPGFGNRHTSAFFAKLEELCQRYLGMGLSEYQQKFKGWYVEG
jgi:hypothetical protein